MPVAVGARFVATASAVATVKRRYSFQRSTTVVLACDSRRGGITIALALSLPDTEWKPLLLSTTDCVVVFSILVQGLTLGRMASHALERHAASG
ncbi:cation:proton antiporter [Rhizobium sp. BK696]|uniref:cation:proton antiporter domain-containing protein n=1 Tax=Rhizobium sp. Rhizsp82 TaxID=3243057 RepID=UPI00102913A6